MLLARSVCTWRAPIPPWCRGLVVDNYSGRPLARTQVRLKSIEGYAAGGPHRAHRPPPAYPPSPPVATGAYLLNGGAARLRPHAVRPKRRGTHPEFPIFLQPDAATFLATPACGGFGAIAGSYVRTRTRSGSRTRTWPSIAPTRPPKLVGRDSRRIAAASYRFGGLEPVQYLVREPAAADSIEETGTAPHVPSRGRVGGRCRRQVLRRPRRAGHGRSIVRPLFGKLCRLSPAWPYPPPQTLTARVRHRRGVRRQPATSRTWPPSRTCRRARSTSCSPPRTSTRYQYGAIPAHHVSSSDTRRFA